MNKPEISKLIPKIAAILFLILGILNIFDGIGKQKLVLSLVGVALIGCCITILIPKKTGRNKTGMRAASAARKLAKMGYGRIYNIGGITSWTGDIER